jgi:hypothetical protein
MMQVIDLLGGPGRTRTCNQTVMSALLSGSILIDFGYFTNECSRLIRVIHW